jgi:antitoxin CcdA
MKKLKSVMHQEVIKLLCDGCGLESSVDEGYEFSEFISIEHTCGFGAIHGDGKQLSIDLCQHCFAGMCGDILTAIEPQDNQESYLAEYGNIFQAVKQSKQDSHELTQDSDTRVKDILSANSISNQEELQIALKRVEQLWDAQYHSAEGNELHTLADLICAFENKNWDSYFSQEPASDDFMTDRAMFIDNIPNQKPGAAKGVLTNTPINRGINEDDSRQSALDEQNPNE